MGFGSSGGGSTKTTTKRDIPSPTWQEKTLLSDIMNARGDYYRPSGRFWDVTSQYYAPSDYFMSQVYNPYTPSAEFTQTMRNPYVSMLPFQEKVGETLGQLANRGVLNSSIGSQALNQLGRWAVERGAEMRNQTLMALENAIRASYEDAWKRALGGENAYSQMLQDILKRTAMGEEAMRMSLEDMWRRIYQPWAVMYQGRMGVPGTVTQTTESSGGGLGGLLGSAVSLGLNYALPGIRGLFGGGGSSFGIPLGPLPLPGFGISF